MSHRIDFHEVLVGILGSQNVYFQPPPSFKIKYPCIIYNRNSIRTDFANNKPYFNNVRYSVTIISADPDSELVEKMAKQPQTSFDRHFTSDGLNHDIFNTYY
jgi:hypothetical protein